MSLSEGDVAVIDYRLKGVERNQGKLHQRINDHEREFETLHKEQGIVREQISGDGGLQNAVHALREDMQGIRRAFYALTATIVTGTVVLATAIATHALH